MNLRAARPRFDVELPADQRHAFAHTNQTEGAAAIHPCQRRRDIEPDPIVATNLRNQNVLAFAGIGRPEKFFATLRALGARVIVARAFADHQPYRPAQLDALFAEAASLGLTPVTTQKALVRLTPAEAANVTALPVALRFDEPDRVAALLASALAKRRAES